MPSTRPRLHHAINVTPLADVMLVLLIIFMVVTPLIRRGVPVRVPEAAHPTEHPDDGQTLVLALQSRGAIWLNETSLAETELESRLGDVLARRAEKLVYLKASETLDYGWVLEVMDACRRAGADEVALITREIAEDGGGPRS